MPIKAWKAALNRFTIQFNYRMPQRYTKTRLHKIPHTRLCCIFFAIRLREFFSYFKTGRSITAVWLAASRLGMVTLHYLLQDAIRKRFLGM